MRIASSTCVVTHLFLGPRVFKLSMACLVPISRIICTKTAYTGIGSIYLWFLAILQHPAKCFEMPPLTSPSENDLPDSPPNGDWPAVAAVRKGGSPWRLTSPFPVETAVSYLCHHPSTLGDTWDRLPGLCWLRCPNPQFWAGIVVYVVNSVTTGSP